MHAPPTGCHACGGSRDGIPGGEGRPQLQARQEAGKLVDLPLPVVESLVLGPVTGIARRWLCVGDIDIEEAAGTVPERIWRSVSP